MDILLLTKLQTLFGFCQFFNYYPLSVPGCKTGYYIAFSYAISPLSFDLWQFLSLSLVFMTLTILRIGQVSYKMSLIVGLSDDLS